MIDPKIRLQKYLAECGVASRRKAEELIKAGQVKVNGQAASLGARVDPQKDKLEVNGKTLQQKEPKVYIKFYKPLGVVSSCRKFQNEQTILDFIPDVTYRLYPVGRLDKNSEGLMILTNDGEWANQMMHPRHGHEKEYEVNVQLTINNEQLTKLGQGIMIEGKKTLPAKVVPLGPKKFSITLREGKKRQIRMMVEAVGNKVLELKRVRMGAIKLGQLKPGQVEYFVI